MGRRIEGRKDGNGKGDLPYPETLLEDLFNIQNQACNYLAKNKTLVPMCFVRMHDGLMWQAPMNISTKELLDESFESKYQGLEDGSLLEYIIVADGRDLLLTDEPYIIVYYGSREKNLRIGRFYEFKGDVLYYGDWQDL